MKRILQTFFVILVSFAVLAACEDKEQTRRDATVEVKKVMAKRKEAIETKNIELYKSLILPEYDDGQSSYKEQVEYMQSLFERYESIQFTYQKSMVDLKMNSARMVGKISYKPKGAEKATWNHEVTLFRRVDGKWFISGGVNLGLI